MNRIIKISLIVIGAYLIIDGIGSIMYYSEQPVVPDHSIRLVRALIGAIVIYISLRR